MAIQMRRGKKAEFDPAKMLPGEWAVAVDSDTNNQIVWMCFAAGVVKRMGTYEDFKSQIMDVTVSIRDEFLADFQSILDDIEILAQQTSINTDTVVTVKDEVLSTYLPQITKYADQARKSVTAAEQAEDGAYTSRTMSAESAIESESYAHGGTGSRAGEDIDNAKYYYNKAKEISDSKIATDTVPGTVKGGEDISIASDGTMSLNTDFDIASELEEVSGDDGRKKFLGKIAKAVSSLINHIGATASTSVSGHVKFGTAQGTACQGNDYRLSNSRIPVPHASTGNGYGLGDVSCYGHVKLSGSNAVTTNSGQALSAIEKNPSIDGTLANQIAQLQANMTVEKFELDVAHMIYLYKSLNSFRIQIRAIPVNAAKNTNITICNLSDYGITAFDTSKVVITSKGKCNINIQNNIIIITFTEMDVVAGHWLHIDETFLE